MAEEAITTLAKAETVTVLAIALILMGIVFYLTARTILALVDRFTRAIEENRKQTALLRQAIGKMDARTSDLMLGNNEIIHQLVRQQRTHMARVAGIEAKVLPALVEIVEIKADVRELKRVQTEKFQQVLQSLVKPTNREERKHEAT